MPGSNELRQGHAALPEALQRIQPEEVCKKSSEDRTTVVTCDCSPWQQKHHKLLCLPILNPLLTLYSDDEAAMAISSPAMRVGSS